MKKNQIHNSSAWLGMLPKHWQVLNLRQFLHPFSEKNHPELPLLSVVREKGVIIRNIEDKEENHNYIPDDLSGYKMVKCGQFVVNKMKAWQGSYGVSEFDGIVSPAYFVFDITYNLNPKFFNKAIRSKIYVNYFGQVSDGIRVGQWDLSMQKMKEIPFFLPPRSEQDQIVRFLDWKVWSINKLIAIKRKQIKTIKEFLCATIETQIHKYPIVDIVRLKSLGKFEKGGGFSRDNLVESNGFPALLYGDIYTQYTYQTSIITHQIDEISYKKAPKIFKRDIIFAGTGETKSEIGKPILYNGDKVVAAGGDVIIFHTNNTINEEYLLFQLYSQESLRFRYIKGKGDIIVHIYPKDLGDMLIPIVNSDNQFKIANDIKLMIIKSDKSIKILKREIETLNKYKTCLISDVVTGKIDIRNIKIPDYEYVEEEIKETQDIDKEITNIEE